MLTYSVPVLDKDGHFVGYRQIEGDPKFGNGSRNARRCISEDDNKAVRPVRIWGRKK